MSKEIKWSIDPTHSEIAFKVRHLLISNVKGTFSTFDASIYTTGKDFTTAVIELWIDANSVRTGDDKRDEHLRGADFFDTKSHQQISFTSQTIGKIDASGKHELWGELTMGGMTKNLKLEVEFGGIQKDGYGNEKAGFTVTGSLNRSDWGLTWNSFIEAGGLAVSDEVHISCDVQLINKGEKNLTMILESDPTKMADSQKQMA